MVHAESSCTPCMGQRVQLPFGVVNIGYRVFRREKLWLGVFRGDLGPAYLLVGVVNNSVPSRSSLDSSDREQMNPLYHPP